MEKIWQNGERGTHWQKTMGIVCCADLCQNTRAVHESMNPPSPDKETNHMSITTAYKESAVKQISIWPVTAEISPILTCPQSQCNLSPSMTGFLVASHPSKTTTTAYTWQNNMLTIPK